MQYCTLSNYADDNNLFSMGKNKDEIKNILFSDFRVVNDWFCEIFMIVNPETSRFMCLGKDIDDTETLSLNDLALKNSKQV